MQKMLPYKKYFISLIIIDIILFCGMSAFQTVADANGQNTNVLILNSYSDFLWTDNLNSGIAAALSELDTEYTTYTESLDFKRFPENTYQKLVLEQFAYKYQNRNIDIIITTDDRALLFALEYREDLFSNAPIVFSGVYKEAAEKIMKTNQNLTGVYEKLDIRTTLQYAMSLNKELENIYLISEMTDIGITTDRMITDIISNTYPKLNVISLSEMDFNEMLDLVSTLDSKSVIMLGPYSLDTLKEHYGGQNVVGILSNYSSVPLYVLYDYTFGTGAMGGNLLIAKEHGKKAGQIAVKIIGGSHISEIELVDEDYYKPMFDYNAMLKHGISLKELPEGSEVIHRNVTFFERYRTGVMIVIGVFIFLVLFITLLLYNIWRRKKVEDKLIERNEIIGNLYETVSESEDKLQLQYNELLETKNQLVGSEERYRLVTEASNDIIFDFFFQTEEFYFPERPLDAFGFSKGKVQYEEFLSWIHPEDKDTFRDTLEQYLQGQTPNLFAEIRIYVDTDIYRWFSIHAKAIWKENQPIRMSGCFIDITEKRENLQMIENLAYSDLLTGLSNRTGFYKVVGEIQAEAVATNSRYALFFIDLDNFKDLNDAFGHDFGDEVLKQAAKRYRDLCEDNIRIARLGGDEFIMILFPATDRMIQYIVDQLLSLNNEKLWIQGKNIYISASIGVAIYPDHAVDYETAIQYSDIAMYAAKKEGKMRYKIFDSSLYHILKDKVKLSEDIRIALEQKEFVVYYQPEIDAITGEISYLEALIRWKHPVEGMISPMEFIPLAEDIGKIPMIGVYVLKEVLEFKKQLNRMGYDKLPISINVSIKQMIEKDFIEEFSEMVRVAGIESSQIIIEITESTFVDSFEEINAKLNLLNHKGFHIALDDFGTGYSSLSYLMRLPIQILKIDKFFIDDVTENHLSRSLMISIIEIAHNLGLKVVAEGVESKEQNEFLTNNGCDYIQGYYYSKPLAEEELIQKLSSYKQSNK